MLQTQAMSVPFVKEGCETVQKTSKLFFFLFLFFLGYRSLFWHMSGISILNPQKNL